MTSGPTLQLVPGQGGDAELLSRVRRGETGAAAKLYDRFSPDINRVVWKLLGGDTDHNDLVHDIFIKVTSQIGRVREPDKLASWVVAVAVNTVYKEIRRRQVRRVFVKNTAVPAEPVTGGDDLEGRDLLRKTYQILEKIPPKERMAFTLRYLDERTLPDVAEMCGWSLATTKRRIERARYQFSRNAARDPEMAQRLGLAEKGTR